MQVSKWLSSPRAQSAHALIQLDPEEPADIEAMAALLDDRGGHFGITAKLVAPAGLGLALLCAGGDGSSAFHGQGLSSASELKDEPRYYEVYVHRD